MGKKVENTAAAETSAPAAVSATGFDPSKVKTVRVVTLPLSKWKIDEPKYLRIEAPIFKGKEVKGSGETTKMEPALLANCVDLTTGEQVQVIVGTVLNSTLNEEYPNDGYVGRSFMITQRATNGKRYKTYSVAEIEA